MPLIRAFLNLTGSVTLRNPSMITVLNTILCTLALAVHNYVEMGSHPYLMFYIFEYMRYTKSNV